MKDLIIISDYDSGWVRSIQIDGNIKSIYGEEEFTEQPYKDISDLYEQGEYNQIVKKYNKNLIICDNGSIEIYNGGLK